MPQSTQLRALLAHTQRGGRGRRQSNQWEELHLLLQGEEGNRVNHPRAPATLRQSRLIVQGTKGLEIWRECSDNNLQFSSQPNTWDSESHQAVTKRTQFLCMVAWSETPYLVLHKNLIFHDLQYP